MYCYLKLSILISIKIIENLFNIFFSIIHLHQVHLQAKIFLINTKNRKQKKIETQKRMNFLKSKSQHHSSMSSMQKHRKIETKQNTGSFFASSFVESSQDIYLANKFQSGSKFNLLSSTNEIKSKQNLLKRSSAIKEKNSSQYIGQKFKLQTEKRNLHQGDKNVEVKQENNFMYTNKENADYLGSKENIHRSPSQNYLVNSSKISTPKNAITIESKWQKIIELYTLREELSKKYHFPSASQLKKNYPILPGGQFYRTLIKNRVFQRDWKINFPETIFLDNDANIVMIYTDSETGVLKKKFIQKQGKQKDKYRDQVLKFKQSFIRDLERTNKMRLFKDLKIQDNPNAPLFIMKYSQDNSFQFQTDVQSYRNFIERKLRPTRDSIVQKYIYSNNLKAMIFRLYYQRHHVGDQFIGPEYDGIRFQNQKQIFKESGSTSFPQIHKLTSTITLSDKRVGTIKVSRISNPKALQKFIVIGKQLQRMLEYCEKVVIDKLYIDFIVDVFDKPWVVNIKYCQIRQNSKIRNLTIGKTHSNNVSSCRLCGVIEKRQNLKNSVSVKMLCQFISHLKKRTKHEDQLKIDFINSVNINSKENKSSLVCKICYKVIIHEFQLIKMQRELAQICNIVPKNQNNFFDSEGTKSKNVNSIGQYKQWRLMLYFEDIKNVSDFSKNDQIPGYLSMGEAYHAMGMRGRNNKSTANSVFVLKYQLCPKICESFVCMDDNSSSNNIKVNQVKLHYFYSETPNIEEFINNTEIIVSLYSAEGNVQNNTGKEKRGFYGQDFKDKERVVTSVFNQKLIASGSTHILSSFNLYKSSSFSLKGLMQNGQKQTATVLLFFKNKKYCQLTLKVGLVYDGSYNVSNIPSKRDNNAEFSNFIKWNQVWFSKNIWNSNPLPKEWMQIFGAKYNYNSLQGSPNKDQSNDQDDNDFEID